LSDDVPNYRPAREFTALHKGPTQQVTGDDGTVYRQGEKAAVTRHAWDALRPGPAASQFNFLGD
jgi:hypothetical protein